MKNLESGWKNRDMKYLIKDKYDWQPWIIAVGIWLMSGILYKLAQL